MDINIAIFKNHLKEQMNKDKLKREAKPEQVYIKWINQSKDAAGSGQVHKAEKSPAKMARLTIKRLES